MDPLFLKYATLFASKGYKLYLIGGTSRDYLLHRPYTDYDFATDATPTEMKAFLPDADYHFEKYGSVKCKEGKLDVVITTLRKEEGYNDHRHPSKISFVKDIEIDAARRDFTINAIYIDKEGKIYDFYHGLEDLKGGYIRFIGEANQRIQEDPLRISRALRFEKKLGFRIEDHSALAIKNNMNLLKQINPEKLKMEEKKAKE